MSNPMVKNDLESLHSLSREALLKRWDKFYKDAPPRGLSSRLMLRAIAYKMQVKHFGELKPSTSRKLNTIATSGNIKKTTSKLNPGTRLVRKWNNVTHIVDVKEKGFEWKNKTYKSLSIIAREITGAHWSGPRFFGLNKGATP